MCIRDSYDTTRAVQGVLQKYKELKDMVSSMTDQDIWRLNRVGIDTNKVYAEKFGIPQSTAITCVKPSGTVS